nr:hypothetical protein HmN_000437100 [Hymenolepis microstoma]
MLAHPRSNGSGDPTFNYLLQNPLSMNIIFLLISPSVKKSLEQNLSLVLPTEGKCVLPIVPQNDPPPLSTIVDLPPPTIDLPSFQDCLILMKLN